MRSKCSASQQDNEAYKLQEKIMTVNLGSMRVFIQINRINQKKDQIRCNVRRGRAMKMCFEFNKQPNYSDNCTIYC